MDEKPAIPSSDVKPGRFAQTGDLCIRWSFMAPAIVLLVAVLAYPVFYTIDISFSRFDIASFGAGEWVGFENYSGGI